MDERYLSDYERCLLGCALIDPTLAEGERIPADYFQNKQNRVIWQAMLALRAAGAPITLLTVHDSLNGNCPPADYLASLTNTTPTAANATFYIDKLREAARRRAILQLAAEVQQEAKRGKESDALIAALEEGILSVRKQADQSATVRPTEALRELIEAAEKRVREGLTGPSGIPAGFPLLDSMTGGFQPGDLILIAARTSIGKSALALSFIRNQLQARHKVALASLEMSATQVWQRLIAMHTGISTGRLRFGHLNEADIKTLVDAASELSVTGLLINDRCDLTVAALRSWAVQMAAEGCRIIYVDYAGLLRGSDTTLPRWEQMSEISRSLKAIARELRIPVVALVQLNREAVGDREPGLHNIRDSGALEQDADVVALLTRKKDSEIAEDTIPACLRLEKQRSGPTGKIDLTFRRSLTQFSETVK